MIVKFLSWDKLSVSSYGGINENMKHMFYEFMSMYPNLWNRRAVVRKMLTRNTMF